MSELKPCPFCGANAEVLDDGIPYGIIEHGDDCIFPSYPKHEIHECDFDAWNTRTERTCNNLADHQGCKEFVCSECGAHYLGFKFVYCPNCGAKVER